MQSFCERFAHVQRRDVHFLPHVAFADCHQFPRDQFPGRPISPVLRQLDLKDGKFDCVISHSVMETPSRKAALIIEKRTIEDPHDVAPPAGTIADCQ